MKPAARNAFVVVVWLMLAAVAPRASAASRDLLAHGTDQYFWSADVVPSAVGEPPGVKTTIRFRTAGDQLRWRTASELAAQPVSLSNRGSELLVVLDDGEWKIVSENGVRSGNPLPNGYRVLAMAGDGDEIWAVGAPRAGSSTRTTATASAATTTTAAASTHPAARDLMLFVLRRGEWKEAQPLPPMLRADRLDALSLALLDGKLMLAVAGHDRAIRLFTRLENGWQGGDDIATLAADGQMKLLTVRGRSALWVAEPGAPGSLYLGGEKWTGPIKLKPSDKLKQYDRRTLAGALGNIRLLASDGKGRLAEQLYALDGSMTGEASEAQTTPSVIENRISRIIQFVVMALLVLWMTMAVRQRPNVADAVQRIDSLGLASIGRRLIGGAIDMLPLFIASFMVTRVAAGQAPAQMHMTYDSPEFAWMSAGLGLYFLHVTVFELIFARSLGKLITATRVASLDGSRPNALAILMRNLLRAVDVALLFVPLLAVFSPLRQRVGDMAAGTVVVLNTTPQPQQTTEPSPPAEPPPAA